MTYLPIIPRCVEANSMVISCQLMKQLVKLIYPTEDHEMTACCAQMNEMFTAFGSGSSFARAFAAIVILTGTLSVVSLFVSGILSVVLSVRVIEVVRVIVAAVLLINLVCRNRKAPERQR